MAEYGIFSEEAAGCIYAPCYSVQEAETERARIIAEYGDEPDDLTIEELCPNHEEQAKATCEECFTEDDGA